MNKITEIISSSFFVSAAVKAVVFLRKRIGSQIRESFLVRLFFKIDIDGKN